MGWDDCKHPFLSHIRNRSLLSVVCLRLIAGNRITPQCYKMTTALVTIHSVDQGLNRLTLLK